MKLAFNIIIFITLAFFSTSIMAQKVYTYNAKGQNCYSEMIFSERSVTPRGVLLIDVQNADIQLFSQKNKYIISPDLSNYNLLFVKILSNNKINNNNCYEALINTIASSYKINKDVFYVLQKPQSEEETLIKNKNEQVYDLNFIYGDTTKIDKIRTALDKSTVYSNYAQAIITHNYSLEYDNKMKNYKHNLDLGFHILPTLMSENRLGLDKKSLTLYGLSMAKNFTDQNILQLAFVGGAKIPNPSSIQSSLQPKIFAAISNGDEKIYINETLSGHSVLGFEALFKRAFSPSKRFRPYAAAGIGFQATNLMSGTIQDSIDISAIDFSNPSSLGGGLGSGLGNQSDFIKAQKNSFLIPHLEVGFDYRLTPVMKFNFSLPLKYAINLSGNQKSTLITGLNIGLSFTLNPNKYEILRTINKKK